MDEQQGAQSRGTAVLIDETAGHVAEPQAHAGAGHGGPVHLPPTSLWPITMAFSISLAASGLVLSWVISLPGLALFVWALKGWVQELMDAQH